MKRYSVITRLASVAVVCGLTLTFASCANEDLAQNGKTTTDDKNLTAFCTGEPATRTTMEADGKFYWEAGDKIWVKDDGGNWKQSSNSPTGKTASFKFLMPGTYTAKSSYEVYYPGKNGNQDQVTISANQTQTEPNTTAHFGASGDCGIAMATRNATNHEFEFALDHKAAYLLFLPHTTNTILQGCYLTKVEVNSDNDITSTYTLDPTTGELTGTGTGKQIIVSTGGSGTYANGFPLTNNAVSAATNGAYVVIKPGTHILKIRYWVKDIASNVEGSITKTLASKVYYKNTYYNITADLNVPDYDGSKYYMWDAQQNYWAGHEWNSANPWQSTLDGEANPNYPQSNSDSRWYHEGDGAFQATHSCATMPNINEMTWYAMKGDPRLDNERLWTTMGHLYKGGMWFKKHDKIPGYSKTQAYDGTDWRTSANSVNNYSLTPGLPSEADASDYFYLPALGSYMGGICHSIGRSCSIWSSSSNPDVSYYMKSAGMLTFGIGGYVSVGSYATREYGARVDLVFE